MQAQVVHDTSVTAPPAQPKRPAVEPVSKKAAASTNNAGEPSPARILMEAFEDLRRRMATLEGRIVEGSNAGEVARMADVLQRVEDQLTQSTSTMPKHASGKLLFSLLVLAAFGSGILIADHTPGLQDGLEQVTVAVSALWHTAFDWVGNLRT
mgnify:CR=1 FL=1|tara:strand:+ start:19838 stop:20296 length:459 start_codon:yes stop_codon:yes gene_type:complete